VFALFGCLLALLGWTGLDAASATLFFAVEPKQIALLAINNLLGAGAATLAVVALTRVRFGKPDASLSANGWISGLAAISGGCAFVVPAAAIIIGMVAGILVTFTVEWLDRVAVDDPGGAISVHAVGGIWGVLAVGLLARIPGPLSNSGNGSGQWLAQLIGISTLLGVILPLSYGLNWLLNRVLPQRVPIDGERQGMDMYELGAGAYPELANSSNDFLQ
jgi:Amt family ammonium transporter